MAHVGGWLINCFRRIFLFFFTCVITQNSLSATSGPYLGGQLGWANVNQGKFIAFHLNQLVTATFPHARTKAINVMFNNTGLAGSIFAGYQFNPYIAAELGYYRFNRLHTNSDMELTFALFKKYTLPVNFNVNASVQTYVVDLLLKGMVPIAKKWNGFLKIGLAYLNLEGKVNISASSTISEGLKISLGMSSNPTVSVIYPAFAIGVNFDMTQHLSTDLSYTRVQQISNKSFPSINLVAVSLVYHFDK